MAGRTLADVGEWGVIAEVTADLPQGPHVMVGPGDDAAALRLGSLDVAVSTDVLVEGRHFRRDWSSGRDVGHKAAAQNMADLIAVGAIPRALLVGLAAPGELPLDWGIELLAGMAAEADPWGCSVVGGDTVSMPEPSSPVVVSVSATGELTGEPVRRSGAAPGEVVALAGDLGQAAAGLAVLRRGFRSPRAVVDVHRRPRVPYAAGLAAARHGATAMIDVSDGLIGDASRLAVASEVCVALHSAALRPPAELAAVGSALGEDAWRWVLAGGEDHAFVATFAADQALPDGFRVVGEVQEGQGVTVDGVRPPADMGGWAHFTDG